MDAAESMPRSVYPIRFVNKGNRVMHRCNGCNLELITLKDFKQHKISEYTTMDAAEQKLRYVYPREFEDMYRCSGCYSEFYTLEEFEEHEAQPFCKEINDLDVLCMEIIFKYLPQIDLWSIGMTCKRFERCVKQYIQRIIHPNPLFIIAWTDQILCFNLNDLPNPAYVKYHRFITAIIVKFLNANSIFVTDYIRRDCQRNISALSLCNFEEITLLNLVHAERLKYHLKHVKDLKLLNIATVNLYAFLNYCKRLRSLTMRYNAYGLSDHLQWNGSFHGVTWLQHNYPNLEILNISVPLHIVKLDLTNFLQHNPNIKQIICDNSTAIESICNSRVKIPSVGLCFATHGCFVNRRFKIKKWCKDRHCDNLEVNVTNLNKNIILECLKLPNLKGFHCGWNFTNIFDSDLGRTFGDIVKLCVVLTYNAQYNQYAQFFRRFVNTFPNLRELRFIFKRRSDDIIKDHILEFLYGFTKLERLLVVDCDVKFSEVDYDNMNFVRSEANNACNVILYTDSVLDRKIDFKRKDEMVTIERDILQLECKVCGSESSEGYESYINNYTSSSDSDQSEDSDL